MKTRNLIFAILWAVLAIIMVVCAVFQFYAGQMVATLIAAMAFGCDSFNAWNHLGIWLEAHKNITR